MHGDFQLGIWVIFGLVMLPVYVMILAWLVGKPREYKPVLLAFGYIAVYIVLTVAGLGILGLAIAFVS